MKNKTINILFALCVVIVLAVLWSGCFILLGINDGIAFAEEVQYSGVLEDLQKDNSFDTANYPKVNTDYSLQVIQIGENKQDEMFVYVYQPCGNSKDLRATTIRIATTIDENAKWQDYGLTYIDNENTLYKYKVDGFKVNSNVAQRYYDIPCIFRPWDETLNDEKPENSNTITEVSYKVNQLWEVFDNGADKVYTMQKADEITITDKYLGTLHYYENGMTFSTSTFVLYIAFSTDILMEKLLAADISFTEEFVYDGSGVIESGEKREKTIYSDQTGSSYDGWYWWSKKHTWKAIEPTKDFIKNEKLSGEAKTYVEAQQWVIRFHTIVKKSSLADKEIAGTYRAAKTTVLRLNFITDGVSYNLGVVDNKQTGSGTIDNPKENIEDIWDWIKTVFNWIKEYWIWIVVGVIVIVAVIVIKPIWDILKTFFQTIWWILSAPFKFIIDLFTGG